MSDTQVEGIAERFRISAAVRDFAALMEARLLEKMRAGWRGWDDPSFRGQIRDALVDDVLLRAEEKAVDIANRAMMLHFMRVAETEPRP